MNGASDTFIDLTKSVDNHQTLAQSCLAMSVNVLDSDRLFPTKGTNLQAGVHNINFIDSTYASHLGNFAALSILQFLYDHTSYTHEDIQVQDIDMGLLEVAPYGEEVKFYQKVYFNDNTSTDDVIKI